MGNEGDGIGLAQLPATIDNFLAAALNLGVLPLHRGKIQVLGALATSHGRRRTTAQSYQHSRAAQNDEMRTGRLSYSQKFGSI